MLSGELLCGLPAFNKEGSKGSFGHGVGCTSPRYVTQPIVYPTGVLGLSPQQGHASRMANRISYFRKKAGLSQVALAEALHSGRSTVTKLERSEIPLTDRWLERLDAILDCTPADLLGDEVPIVGKVGAGGTVAFEDMGIEDMVRRPPDTSGDLVGLEVCGESMLPKFDPGDIVYISRQHDGVDPADIGAICACRLVTGETYLKQVLKGSRAGTFTLRSYNAADMEDCDLEWATPIRAVTPRQARRFH